VKKKKMKRKSLYSDSERLDLLEQRIMAATEGTALAPGEPFVYTMVLSTGMTIRKVLDAALDDYHHGTPADSLAIVLPPKNESY